MRKLHSFIIWVCCLSLLLGCDSPCPVEDPNTQQFGLFLGLNAEDIQKMSGYDLVVLEGQEFSAADIAQLHAAGQEVYSYLNIGSVEEYRSYYHRYHHLALGVYENWDDERWIDVSAPSWQSFLVDTLASEFVSKGIDGFFLDNADVYYEYPQESIYQGLLSIIKHLGKHNKPMMLNGGDTFMLRALEEDRGAQLLQAIHQETVFTSIDFDKETYGKQNAEDKAYYQEYIETCAAAGMRIYLTEYGASATLQEEIKKYCHQHGFLYYIAPTLDLTGY